jgi:flavin reductase (DIM6/NTAB) family NADH-FMN oxidoreductase RutF
LNVVPHCSVIIEPDAAGFPNVYKVMVGSIVPRPIAFVSTVSAEGTCNLSPFSFFTGVSANPPVVCFCPLRNADGSKKDTLQNIERTGDFVVNIVSEEFVEQMNATSGEYAAEVDEFQVSGLTPVPSEVVKAPRVKESHVSMECKLFQIFEISSRPQGGSIVTGEIVRLHVDDAYIDNFHIDPDRLRAIGRMAGNTYVRTGDRFDMARPVVSAAMRR